MGFNSAFKVLIFLLEYGFQNCSAERELCVMTDIQKLLKNLNKTKWNRIRQTRFVYLLFIVELASINQYKNLRTKFWGGSSPYI
jgi:hypothetical protein